ncbi:hypothetical protein Tco_0382217 [Tanacetum coccineum]
MQNFRLRDHLWVVDHLQKLAFKRDEAKSRLNGLFYKSDGELSVESDSNVLEQQRRARQPGPEARIPDHQDAFGDADSHI